MTIRQRLLGSRRGAPVRASTDLPVVLRPGIAIPLMGYLAAAAFAVVAVVAAFIAQPGKPASISPPGEWAVFGIRLAAGEFVAASASLFYRMGSMRIVLRAASMEIVGWGLKWIVGRDEVLDVALRTDCVVFMLADGTRIRPAMFWSSGPGIIYLRLGLFQNAMSRTAIRNAILEWRQEPKDPDSPPPRSLREYLRRRHWRVRGDLGLPAGLAVVIVIVAIVATVWL